MHPYFHHARNLPEVWIYRSFSGTQFPIPKSQNQALVLHVVHKLLSRAPPVKRQCQAI